MTINSAWDAKIFEQLKSGKATSSQVKTTTAPKRDVTPITGGIAKPASSTTTHTEVVMRVKYDVPIYDQGDLNLCWAYCQVMVESNHMGIEYDQEKADERAIQLAKEAAKKRFGNEKYWNHGGIPSNISCMVNPEDLKNVNSFI